MQTEDPLLLLLLLRLLGMRGRLVGEGKRSLFEKEASRAHPLFRFFLPISIISEVVNKPRITKTDAKKTYKVTDRELLSLPLVHEVGLLFSVIRHLAEYGSSSSIFFDISTLARLGELRSSEQFKETASRLSRSLTEGSRCSFHSYLKSAVEALSLRSHGGVSGHQDRLDKLQARKEKGELDERTLRERASDADSQLTRLPSNSAHATMVKNGT